MSEYGRVRPLKQYVTAHDLIAFNLNIKTDINKCIKNPTPIFRKKVIRKTKL